MLTTVDYPGRRYQQRGVGRGGTASQFMEVAIIAKLCWVWQSITKPVSLCRALLPQAVGCTQLYERLLLATALTLC